MKADQNLINFIKAYDESNTRKGFALFTDDFEEIFVVKKSRKQYFIEVPSQSGNYSFYTVLLNVLTNNVEDNCDCKAYEKYGQCKHTVAAALYVLMDEFDYDPDVLQELIGLDDIEDEFGFMETKLVTKNSKAENGPAKVIRMNETPNTEWKEFEMGGIINQSALHNLSGHFWTSVADFNKLRQISFDEKERHWIFNYDQGAKQVYTPEIKYDGNVSYRYRCNCVNNTHLPMCRHVRVVFDKFINQHGYTYFREFKDWTTEKNDLLKDYGLTVNDEEAKLFKFDISYSGDLLMQAPTSFMRSGDKLQLKKLHDLLKPQNAIGIPVV